MPGKAQEHFDHCLERAMTYMNAGKPTMAIESLKVDLRLHPDTRLIAYSSEFVLLVLGNMDNSEKFREAMESLKAKML